MPQHTSILTGQLCYDEIIEHDNVAYFRIIARMERESFLLLLDLLEREGGLKRSFEICAGQKLMIFIHILVRHSNRQTAGRWQHSGRTISIVIHEVALSEFQIIYFKF